MGTTSHLSDIKGLGESHKDQKVSPDETVVSFDISAIFTSMTVPIALDMINRKFMKHINEKGTEHFFEIMCFA